MLLFRNFTYPTVSVNRCNKNYEIISVYDRWLLGPIDVLYKQVLLFQVVLGHPVNNAVSYFSF